MKNTIIIVLQLLPKRPKRKRNQSQVAKVKWSLNRWSSVISALLAGKGLSVKTIFLVFVWVFTCFTIKYHVMFAWINIIELFALILLLSCLCFDFAFRYVIVILIGRTGDLKQWFALSYIVSITSAYISSVIDFKWLIGTNKCFRMVLNKFVEITSFHFR